MKTLVMYLPQFYTTPENDKWWGKGYTEWIACKEASPIFDGQYQPHIPLNNNYYNLLDKKTMETQSELMHSYGIDGMCFYHYWFGKGKKTLEKPAENLLRWQDISMPFCFAWANVSWVNAWSKLKGFPWKKSKIYNKSTYIFHQEYGRNAEWIKHIEYLYKFFQDERYIRKDGRPVFIINDVDNIFCFENMLDVWNRWLAEHNEKELYIIARGSQFVEYSIDEYMTHEPGDVRNLVKPEKEKSGVKIYSYEHALSTILNEEAYYPTSYMAFCSFDNTPRYGKDGVCFEDSSPELFEHALFELSKKNLITGSDFLFIDAWNEWGEGMHIEPDEKYGYEWLQAIKRTKELSKDFPTKTNSFWKERKSTEIYKLSCEKKKTEMYLNTLSQWISLREQGRKFFEVLDKYNISSVLIYGDGVLARHLIWDIKQTDIKLIGIIDRRKIDNCEIPYYSVAGDYPRDGAIIVTAYYHMKEIYKTLRVNGYRGDIYSIQELVSTLQDLNDIDSE